MIPVYSVELDGKIIEFISFRKCYNHYGIFTNRNISRYSEYSIVRDGKIIAKVFKDKIAAYGLSNTIKNNLIVNR